MKKFFALLLCFALILPFAPPAKAETATAESAALESVNTVTEKTEIVSMRDAYSKTYQLPDGTYQYVARTAPIHYLDSTGAYAEINNEITNAVKRSGYAYTNTANAWNAYFAEKLGSDNAVMMESGKYNIAFSLLEQTGTLSVEKAGGLSARGTLSAYYQKLASDNRAVIYRDVVSNVDVAYTVHTGTLKEDIILKSKNAPSTFKFRLTTNGLTIKESNGTVALVTASGEEVFTFVPLYMEDANGKRSENVSMSYTSVKNGYELTVSADTEFLNAADTAYPVVIDPAISVTGASVTYDTYVNQASPGTNYYLSDFLWTGGTLGTDAMYTYIKFILNTDILPVQVTAANIHLTKCSGETPRIRAHLVEESWNSDEVTWIEKPDFSSLLNVSSEVMAGPGDSYILDVTDMVEYWLGNPSSNFGVALKETDNNPSTQKTCFYSSDSRSNFEPMLIINYVYYSSRPYHQTSRTDISDLGYAFEFDTDESWYELNLTQDALYGKSLDAMQEVLIENLTLWMNLNLGHDTWGQIDAYNSSIGLNHFKVVVQIGFEDTDEDGVLGTDDYCAIRCMYQTEDLTWAGKSEYMPSCEYTQLSPNISPNILPWDSDAMIENSICVYFQVADIRNINW